MSKTQHGSLFRGEIPGAGPAGKAALHRRALAGAALVITLLALALVIFFLDPIARKAERLYTLVAVLPEAHRIQSGTPVSLAGSNVGHVTAVELLPAARTGAAQVAVRLQVPERFRTFIRGDSRVQVRSATPLSPPILDIAPGSPHAPVLSPGDTLQPAPVSPLDAAVDAGLELRAAFDSLRPAATLVLRRARLRHHQLATLHRHFTAVLHALDTLQAHLPGGSLAAFAADSTLHGAMRRLGDDARSVRTTLAQQRSRVDSLAAAAAAAGRAAPDTGAAGTTVARLQRLARRLDRLQTQLENGSLSRFRHDRALLDALRGARAQLDSLTAQIGRSPLDFFR